jgi:hypothetical protein
MVTYPLVAHPYTCIIMLVSSWLENVKEVVVNKHPVHLKEVKQWLPPLKDRFYKG